MRVLWLYFSAVFVLFTAGAALCAGEYGQETQPAAESRQRQSSGWTSGAYSGERRRRQGLLGLDAILPHTDSHSYTHTTHQKETGYKQKDEKIFHFWIGYSDDHDLLTKLGIMLVSETLIDSFPSSKFASNLLYVFIHIHLSSNPCTELSLRLWLILEFGNKFVWIFPLTNLNEIHSTVRYTRVHNERYVYHL